MKTPILQSKINQIIKNEKLTKWISSYYKDRKQYTSWENTQSEVVNCNEISIVQGSALGPKMFITFINDLRKSSSFYTITFADDTNLLLSNKDPEKLENLVNEELAKIKDYFDANGLAINTEKSNFVIFNNKKKNGNFHKFNIRIGQENLEEKSELEYLGVIIDNKMSFKPHFNKLQEKLKKGMNGLIMSKNFLSYQAKLSIYFGLIHSHLEYCALIWMPNLRDNEIKILKTIQKKAIRILFKAKFNSHTSKLFEWSRITKVENIFNKQSLILCQKYQNRELPHSIHKILHDSIVRSGIETRTNKTNNFIISNKSGRTLHKILNSWNNAPEILKYTKSKVSLKREFSKIMNKSAPCRVRNCYSCKENWEKLLSEMKF